MKREWEERKRHYLRRLANLERERTSWESHWRELSDRFLPRRSRFLSGGDKTNDGAELNKKIIDSVGTQSLRVLASGLHSGLTDQTQRWFMLGLANREWEELSQAKLWLHDTTERMFSTLSKSNFYDQIHSLFCELALFGTGCMFIEEDNKDLVRFRTLTAGEYSLDADASGRVDTVYRRIRMTARQIVDQWPDFAPDRVEQMAKEDNTTWLEVLHVVEPNPDYKPDRVRGAERPYSSVYMMLGMGSGNEVLEDSGYYEFPAFCPRWDTTGSDVYGRSPAMDALPDVKMLQVMAHDGIEAVRKEVNPPLNIASTAGGAAVNINPGALNYISPMAQGGQVVSPLYDVKANLPGLHVWIEKYETQVRQALFNDLFAMLAHISKSMTATEVQERNAEKLLQLSPTVSRLRGEFQNFAERLYAIMDRRGAIGLPPDEMQGQEINVEFIGYLDQMLKMQGMGAIQQVIEMTVGLAQAYPQVLDMLNADKAVSEIADMTGVPPTFLNSEEDIRAIRSQRAQAQEQERQMQAWQAGAAIAKDGAGALKDGGAAMAQMREQPAEGVIQ